MTRPVRRLLLLGASAVAMPGCLTLSHSQTEVVWGSETRRSVQFESPEAADLFKTAVASRSNRLGSSYYGVPFVGFCSKDRILSDAARWNDAAAGCDTDQDGVISLAEAKAFSRKRTSER